MVIGTVYIGKVDGYKGQAIKTQFLIIGLPLLPLKSVFFIEGNTGFDVGLSLRSAGLAYIRWWLGIVTFIGGLAGIVGVIHGQPHGVPATVAAALAAFLWVPAAFVWGRLKGERKVTAALLHAGSGISADPRILPREMRQNVFTRMQAGLAEDNLPTDPDHWLSNEPKPEMLAALYVLAAYGAAGSEQPARWEELKDKLLVQIARQAGFDVEGDSAPGAPPS
ncbi:MAG: hypothetical protein ACYTGB_19955 [Planctomycetota bacterium]|jgi:hypothetical protein